MGEVERLLFGQATPETVRAALERKRRLFYCSFPGGQIKGNPHVSLALSTDDFGELMDSLYYTGAFRTGANAKWARDLRVFLLNHLGIHEVG